MAENNNQDNGGNNQQGQQGRWNTRRILTIVGTAAAAVTVTVVATPLVAPAALGAAGFGAGGVVAGSVAAGAQAMIGNVAAGSLFAACQSAGATGVIAASTTAGISGTIGAAATGIATFFTRRRQTQAPDPPDDDYPQNGPGTVQTTNWYRVMGRWIAEQINLIRRRLDFWLLFETTGESVVVAYLIGSFINRYPTLPPDSVVPNIRVIMSGLRRLIELIQRLANEFQRRSSIEFQSGSSNCVEWTKYTSG